ncbi:MAG: carbohydrate-binding family 9-like protein, partial [Armatimonadetes bacterium]|nr:carbohydrate-binding family 9-like protein [Armatimonadota bacterium]
DNANGSEDYPNLGIDFSQPEDWLPYERLELWARCQSNLPERTERHLCVELVDGTGRVHDIHFQVPVGEWRKISVDLAKIPREAIRGLRLFVYEMDERGADYTWWFDDLALINDDPRPLADNEALVRAVVVNPLSAPVAATVGLQLPEGWTMRPHDPQEVAASAGETAAAEFTIQWPQTAIGRGSPIRGLIETKHGPLSAEVLFQPLPRITAPRVGQAPRIDGRLDDPAWREAAWVSGFVRNTDAQPVSATTRAGLCWDGEHLFVAFVCEEPHMEHIVAKHKERDSQVWMDDCIEVYIDADADRQPGDYDHYVVNTLGVLRDERGGDGQWNSRARAAASVGRGEWYVELAIPWADYDGQPPRQPWAINLHRTRQPKPGLAEPEYQCWSCTHGPFDNPSAFGILSFAGGNQ